ncbi:MAG: hypothetical protein C4589_08175 [Peptococcaceae bacterium]|nr:MAG: hypothetical protein C4589_08175 [Peptococcaceae bacterium]
MKMLKNLKNLKMFMAGFLACLMLTGLLSAAFAAEDLSVQAILSNAIKLKLNGKDWTPQDPATGDYYRPIVYNSRAYLPVRAVVEAAGIPVDYDSATKTIWIGGKNDVLQVNDTIYYKDDYGTIITTDEATLTSPDRAYKWGVTNDKDLSMQYFNFYLKPNGKYQQFRASFFLDSSAKDALTVNIRKESRDGEVLKSIVLQPGETLSDVDVGIGGTNQIYIEANIRINHGTIKKLIVGEPVFYNGALPAKTPVRS